MGSVSRRSFLAQSAGALAWAVTPQVAAAGREHQVWDSIVSATVSPEGWVDYARLQKEFGAQLASYLESLARAPAGGREQQIAFWVNAYNAVCVKTLIEEGLPAEVPHAKFLGKNIFSQKRFVIGGERRSLDDIEHDILRRRFKDPRLHAALVCGASSCPRLSTRAYQGATLSSQLDTECQSWIRTETTKGGQRKNYLDRSRQTYFASKIFDWYQPDFGGTDQGVLDFIRRFADTDDRAVLQQDAVTLEYLDYDWRLNKQ